MQIWQYSKSLRNDMIKILIYYLELISHVEKMKWLSLCILNFTAFLRHCLC